MNSLDALMDGIVAMFSSSNKSFPCLYYEAALLVGVQIGPTKCGNWQYLPKLNTSILVTQQFNCKFFTWKHTDF